jgi:hypothetical protein
LLLRKTVIRGHSWVPEILFLTLCLILDRLYSLSILKDIA